MHRIVKKQVFNPTKTLRDKSGNAVTGAAAVIPAMGAGITTAKAIHEHFSGGKHD